MQTSMQTKKLTGKTANVQSSCGAMYSDECTRWKMHSLEKRKAGGLGVRVSALIRKSGVLTQRRANLGEDWLTVRQIKR